MLFGKTHFITLFSCEINHCVPMLSIIPNPFLPSGNTYHRIFVLRKDFVVSPFSFSLWFTLNHFKLIWQWKVCTPEWIIYYEIFVHFVAYVRFSDLSINWNEKAHTPGHPEITRAIFLFRSMILFFNSPQKKTNNCNRNCQMLDYICLQRKNVSGLVWSS